MWPFDNLASSIGRPSLGRLTLKQGALSSQLQERKGLPSQALGGQVVGWGKGLIDYEAIHVEALSVPG